MMIKSLLRSAMGLALVTSAPCLAAQTPWPTAKWATGSPESLGLNGKVLDSIDAEIRAGKYGLVDHMLVIRHGKIAYERGYKQNYDSAYADSVHVKGPLNAHDETGPYNYYNAWWHPYYRRGELHSLQSVTKTITSVIIGVASAKGDFPAIERPVLSFFDESKVANVDDRKRKMTVRNLLSMTAGFDWNESLPYTDPRNSATALEESADWVKYVIDRPMALDPGAKFVYNSGASVLLAEVFRRATGRDIEEYAAKNLFAPLGIEHWYWKRTPTGLIDSEGGLYLEAADLAKIWYLFLHNGEWNGKQIVTQDWARNSVSPIIATGNGPASAKYGLSWWLYQNPSDSTKLVVSGSGFGGQLPMYLPDEDMVVVFNAWNILPGRGGLPRPRITARLINAVTDRKR